MPSQSNNAERSDGRFHPQPTRKRGPAVIGSALAASILFAGLLPPLHAHISGQPDTDRQRLSSSARAAAAKNAVKPAGLLRQQLNGKAGTAPVAAAVLYFGLLPATGAAPADTATAVDTSTPTPVPTEKATSEPPRPNPADEARALAERWARAWSERDVGAYLSAYSKDFAPGNGIDRSAWEQSRRQKIEGRKSISVAVRDLKIETLGEDRVEVRFLQDYAADNFHETGTPKLLVLARADGGWRIIGETTETAQLARK